MRPFTYQSVTTLEAATQAYLTASTRPVESLAGGTTLLDHEAGHPVAGHLGRSHQVIATVKETGAKAIPLQLDTSKVSEFDLFV